MQEAVEKRLKIAKWMSLIPDKTLPLRGLMVPATHDSASYTLDFSLPALQEEEFGFLRKFLILPSIKKTIENWAITNSYNLYSQCLLGIRCFDLRIKKATDGTWWLFHGFKNILFSEGLKQLYQFSKEYPSEILFLYIGIRDVVNDQDREDINNLFNPYRSFMNDWTKLNMNNSVKEFQDSNINWVCFATNYMSTKFKNWFQTNTVFSGKWFNEWDQDKQWNNIQTELNGMLDKNIADRMYWLSWTLTVQTQDVIESGFINSVLPCKESSLKEACESWNAKLLPFTLLNEEKIKKKVWCLCADFFDSTILVDFVLKCNNVIL